jgi:hypothetical protein
MNTLPRFFEWDYDQNVVIEYERQGDCNSCGQCCMALIEFTISGLKADRAINVGDGGPSTTGKGVWHEVRIGNKRRFFQVDRAEPNHKACSHLMEDMLCDVHLTKPLLHKSWPMSPRQVIPFDQCSYTFREVDRAEIVEPIG